MALPLWLPEPWAEQWLDGSEGRLAGLILTPKAAVAKVMG